MKTLHPSASTISHQLLLRVDIQTSRILLSFLCLPLISYLDKFICSLLLFQSPAFPSLNFLLCGLFFPSHCLPKFSPLAPFFFHLSFLDLPILSTHSGHLRWPSLCSFRHMLQLIGRVNSTCHTQVAWLATIPHPGRKRECTNQTPSLANTHTSLFPQSIRLKGLILPVMLTALYMMFLMMDF